MSIEFLKEQVDDMVGDYIRDSEAVEVSAKDIGLDPRAGDVLISWSERWIAVPSHSARCIEHFGGFEYINHKNKTVLGGYTFYDDGSDRVDECIDYYADHHVDQ
tara:strand:- start:81 stop:392 length:312 start_codon:yes stop_codon:yes gene_type:complete